MEIDSTPPATNTSPSPARIRWLARAMVCRPEEQKRLTVIPGTVTGQPARIAIWRAMFQPVAPSGLAQPMITSSTSSASTLARSSAACTTWPPIFAPWVVLSAPRQLLQSGVRAVETITASVIGTSSWIQCRLQERLDVLERLLLDPRIGGHGGAARHAIALQGLEHLLGRVEHLAGLREHGPAVVLVVQHALAQVLRPGEPDFARLAGVAVEAVV